eukprot:UN27322
MGELQSKQKIELESKISKSTENEDNEKKSDDTKNTEIKAPENPIQPPQKKMTRAMKRKEKKRREKEEAHQRALEEVAKIPNLKQEEIHKIQEKIPNGSLIKHTKADGHCMYRAIADQLTEIGVGTVDMDWRGLRKLCADYVKNIRMIIFH